MLQIECTLVLVLGREDDAGRDDTAGCVAIDDAAVGLPVSQLLDGAAGEVGEEGGDPLQDGALGGSSMGE